MERRIDPETIDNYIVRRIVTAIKNQKKFSFSKRFDKVNDTTYIAYRDVPASIDPNKRATFEVHITPGHFKDTVEKIYLVL
jgi:hypothetical protein